MYGYSSGTSIQSFDVVLVHTSIIGVCVKWVIWILCCSNGYEVLYWRVACIENIDSMNCLSCITANKYGLSIMINEANQDDG